MLISTKHCLITLFSIEILPPLKGKTIDDLFTVLDPLMEFNPPFVDVTYHREEIIYKKRPDGLVEEVPMRRRPGTVGICAAIKARYKVDTVPHLVCGGFTKSETEDAIFSLYYVGIENFILIRGDSMKGEPRFVSTEGGNEYALDLVNQVSNMNKGHFLYEETDFDMKTDFCIGVAGYPEKHFEAPNLGTDMKFLKQKVDAGANYIVTQMFFDNQKFFEFVKKCRETGIDVPIIPGLKPITTKKQVYSLPPLFHIDIPEELSTEVEKCKDNREAMEVGVEWTTNQAKELKKFGVPCLHFYTMSRNEATLAVAKQIF